MEEEETQSISTSIHVCTCAQHRTRQYNFRCPVIASIREIVSGPIAKTVLVFGAT